MKGTDEDPIPELYMEREIGKGSKDTAGCSGQGPRFKSQQCGSSQMAVTLVSGYQSDMLLGLC